MSSCSLCLPPPFVHQREGEAKESASLALPTLWVVPTHPLTIVWSLLWYNKYLRKLEWVRVVRVVQVVRLALICFQKVGGV